MRARNIKPGFYKNEQLAECSFEARLLFPGLWMIADRSGRMEYRPKRIKAEIFPFDNVDIPNLIRELENENLVSLYEVDGRNFLWIHGFSKHQIPHHKEKQSEIPPHPSDVEPGQDQGKTRVNQGEDQGYTRKGECQPALNPESLILNPEISPNGDLSPSDGDVNTPKGENTPEPENNGKKLIPPCPHKEIISAYHEALPGCPQIRVWDETSKKNLQARWKEDASRRDVSWWEEKFQEVAKSDFLMGRSNGSGGMPFMFSLGWFVRPSNFAKVLNGNYVNRGAGKTTNTGTGKHSGFENKNYGESGLL